MQVLSDMGDGCPDLLIGYQGRNYLMEVKNPGVRPSRRKLTPKQVEFFATWLGQVAKVETESDVLKVLGIHMEVVD